MASEPPSVLLGVSKVVLRSLDLGPILLEALEKQKHPQPYGPVLALYALDRYWTAAQRQQRRIRRAKAGTWKLRRAPGAALGCLFDDTHFYLICWARIAKLMRFIAKSTRFRQAGTVLRGHRRDLDARIDGRDHLEHFEERLPGAKNQHKLAVQNDLLNMRNDNLRYGGKQLDIGPGSLRLLKSIVADFREALLFDAAESLATTDLDSLRRHVRRAIRDVQVARLAKQAERQFARRQ